MYQEHTAVQEGAPEKVFFWMKIVVEPPFWMASDQTESNSSLPSPLLRRLPLPMIAP